MIGNFEQGCGTVEQVASVSCVTELRSAQTSAPSTARRRVVEWADPALSAAAATGRTGLDFLRAIANGELSAPSVAGLLGMQITEVESGRVVFVLETGEHLDNPIGSVHGGIISTVLDSAVGCAVHTMLGVGQGCTTLELKVNFDRALTVAVPFVRAEADISPRDVVSRRLSRAWLAPTARSTHTPAPRVSSSMSLRPISPQGRRPLLLPATSR